MKIEHADCVASTNDSIKKYLPQRENVVLFADRQTAGRGTKGRSFLSDMGGVYCSFLIFHKDMPPANAFRVMAHAAVAVCRTAAAFSIRPEIKWPNDVRSGGRKLAGILIENGIADGKIDHSIVGIGLNVTNDVSSLGDIAISMGELGCTASAEEVGNLLLEAYLNPSTFDEYLAHVHFLGKRIRVTERDREYLAIARRILPDGRLEVESDGIRTLSSAEIMLLD